MNDKKDTTQHYKPLHVYPIEYQILKKAILNCGLNDYEIRHKIKLFKMSDDNIELAIDLHGFNVEMTKELLLKIMSIKRLNIASIDIIHGYSHGAALKKFIVNDFDHERLARKREHSTNLGKTTLILNPWIENKGKSKRSKSSFQKINVKNSKQEHTKKEEYVKENTKFMLEMMKEKVRESSIKSIRFDKSYIEIMSETEKNYSEDIIMYNFELDFFLNKLASFYSFENKILIEITAKKLAIDKLEPIIETIIQKSQPYKLDCYIKTNKKVIKKLTENQTLMGKLACKITVEGDKLVIKT